jgi:hypothetical protein
MEVVISITWSIRTKCLIYAAIMFHYTELHDITTMYACHTKHINRPHGACGLDKSSLKTGYNLLWIYIGGGAPTELQNDNANA